MKECLMRNKGLLVLVLLLGMVSSVAAVFLAKVLQKIIDTALSGDFGGFWRILLVSMLYLFLLGFLTYLFSLCEKKLIRNVIRDLRQKVFSGIFRKNLRDFNRVNTSDYLSALTNDIKIIEENYLLPALLVLQYGMIFLTTLFVLLTISPLITACLGGMTLVMFLLPGLLGKPMALRQEVLSRRFSLFTAKLKDFCLGYEVIRSFQLKQRVNEDFSTANTTVTEAKYAADRLLALNEGIAGVFAYFTQFSGLFIGAYLIIKGQITAGTLVALIQLAGTFISPVTVILENTPRIRSAAPILKRLETMMETSDERASGTGEPTLEKQIDVKGLHFYYEKGRPVLKNLDLRIEKNKKYVIVGKSGCGKTTLIKILTGECDGFDGKVTFDGIDIRRMDPDKMAKLFGVIHQNIFLFDDSVKQNIVLYNDFSEEEINKVLSMSGAAEFMKDLPGGVEAPVGENGANLSGGQRQRIAVARALIRKKPVLILDEGTSACDRKTAYDIERKLLKIPDVTLITITHDLNRELLRLYDEVILMEDGCIAERGSFHSLLGGGRFSAFMEGSTNAT